MLGGRIDERLRGSLKGRGRARGPRTLKDFSRRQTRAVAGGLVGVLAAGVLVWALWPEAEVEPRAREYRDVTACLLTDGQGVAGERAAPLWAGMQAASERTRGQARYLEVTGEQTVENAKTFVGTLLLGRCSVILATPGIADEAVRALAGSHPAQRFLVVGGADPEVSNVSKVDGSAVADVVADRLASGE